MDMDLYNNDFESELKNDDDIYWAVEIVHDSDDKYTIRNLEDDDGISL